MLYDMTKWKAAWVLNNTKVQSRCKFTLVCKQNIFCSGCNSSIHNEFLSRVFTHKWLELYHLHTWDSKYSISLWWVKIFSKEHLLKTVDSYSISLWWVKTFSSWFDLISKCALAIQKKVLLLSTLFCII